MFRCEQRRRGVIPLQPTPPTRSLPGRRRRRRTLHERTRRSYQQRGTASHWPVSAHGCGQGKKRKLPSVSVSLSLSVSLFPSCVFEFERVLTRKKEKEKGLERQSDTQTDAHTRGMAARQKRLLFPDQPSEKRRDEEGEWRGFTPGRHTSTSLFLSISVVFCQCPDACVLKYARNKLAQMPEPL